MGEKRAKAIIRIQYNIAVAGVRTAHEALLPPKTHISLVLRAMFAAAASGPRALAAAASIAAAAAASCRCLFSSRVAA